MIDLKITQKDLNKIPKATKGVDEEIIKYEFEISLRFKMVEVIQYNFGYEIPYVKEILTDINNDMLRYQRKMVGVKKQQKCEHKLEDLKWKYEGSDSHKDHYKFVCTACGLRIDNYSH